MDLVLITWLDSGKIVGNEWTFTTDLPTTALVITCQSVGWIVRETEEELVIAPHVGAERDGRPQQFLGLLAIPKVAIQQRTPLPF